MRTSSITVSVCFALVLWPAAALAQTPLGTAFTYQGQLKEAGVPVDDTADFQFRLYDAPLGGMQIGATLPVSNVEVDEGQFTVWLDFGSGAFAGEARWLEIAVRVPAGSGPYTTLSPRQELTAVPYALYALSGPGGGGNADTVDYFHANASPTANTLLALDANAKFPNDALYTGAFNGLDADLLDGQHAMFFQDAGNLIFGTLPDLRLSSNVALLDNGQVFTGPKTFTAAPSFMSDPPGPPFNVWSDVRVMNLNADLLDGLDSTAFLRTEPPLELTGEQPSGHIIKGGNSSTVSGSHGVVGESISTEGAGVYGQTASPDGYGVYANGGPGRALRAESSGHDAIVALSSASGRSGVYTRNIAASGTTYGVYALSASDAGTGVLGEATAATGTTYGVFGRSLSPTGCGVYGTAPGENSWAGYFVGRGFFSDWVGIGTSTPLARLHVAGAPGVDGIMFPDGSLQTTAAAAGSAWSLTGNSGTTPGTNFIGTTDDTALEIKVNNARALRIEPKETSANLIGGSAENSVTTGVYGALIGGGDTNTVTDNFGVVAGGATNRAGNAVGSTHDAAYATVGGGASNTASGICSTIGGGWANTASGQYSTVGGGWTNTASGHASAVGGGRYNTASGVWSTVAGGTNNAAGGDNSFAGGYRAKVRDANQSGDPDGDEATFVWADTSALDFFSTGPNQFLIRATGGVGINVNNPAPETLEVVGSGDYVIKAVHCTTETDGPAILGDNEHIDYRGIGVKGLGGAIGVYGASRRTGSIFVGHTGVHGQATSDTGTNCGLYGYGASGSENFGVYAMAEYGPANYGVYGHADPTALGYAGYFKGNVEVNGTLWCPDKHFKIDHPLDPENKCLVHACVESDERLNVYSGVVTTDERGYATVALPAWFEALNRDFRYQLTVIGQFAQAIIAEEVRDNRFVIRTDKPSVKVSWQVSGVRQDPYARAHPMQAEVEKTQDERGKYLDPELYGQPEELGLHRPPRVAPKQKCLNSPYSATDTH